MKKIVFILMLLLSMIASSKEVKIKIEDIVKKVSTENFLVLENAQRVYQKKEIIKFSRGSLLPKLNLWTLLKIPAVFADPLSIGDIIQDVAPFLVPANWFKLSQSKNLYKAQKEQYRALWANELSTAKLLFMGVYGDQLLSDLITQKIVKYKEILEIAKSQNIFGRGNIFAYNLIKNRYLALLEDSRHLRNLLYSEKKELQFLTGIRSEDDISLSKPFLPEPGDSFEIESDKIIFKAIDSSPEIYQYQHLLNSLSQVKGQINYSILGVSTYSSVDNIFDHIPIQDGMGFGMGASVRIAKSERRILKNQLKATSEIIKRQVLVLVNEYNSLIENDRTTKERLFLAKENYQIMMGHIAIGGNLEVMEMIEILDNFYTAKVLMMSYKIRFSSLVEKLMRVTFSGDYTQG